MRKNIITPGLPYCQRARYSNAAVNNIGNGTLQVDPNAGGGSPRYSLQATAVDPTMGRVQVSIVEAPTTVNPGGADFKANGGTTYPQGTVVEVYAKAYQGYRFVSWNNPPDGMGRQSNPMRFAINSNVVMSANFVAVTPQTVTHTVTAKPNNAALGSISGIPASGVMTVNDRATVTLKAIPAEGCHFVKWEGHNFAGTPTNESATVTFTCVSDLNLTAIFAKDVNTNGGGGDTPPNDDHKDPGQGTGGGTPGTGGGSGGGSGSGSGTPTDPVSSAVGFDVVAFAKKWWWALLIGAYILYKEMKGGKQ